MRFEHAASDATTGQKSPGLVARRAAPRRSLRRQRQRRHGAAGHVLAVLGQVQRGAVLAQHERRQLGPLHDGRTSGRPAKDARSRPASTSNNYAGVVAGTFPALNVQFADDLSSPLTTEYTLGAARMFGARSYAKAVFVQRKTSNFIEEFIQYRQRPDADRRRRRDAGAARQHRVRQQRRDEARVPGAAVHGAAPADERAVRQRPLDGAAEERRQLRRRDAESDRLGVRRLSGNAVARAQRSGRTPRRLPAQQGSRVGRLPRRASAGTARSPLRRSIATTRRGPTASC